MLGVGRSTISQWRKREAIPKKYLALLPKSKGQIVSALNNALRIHVFGDRENAYWIAAILAALPSELFKDAGEDPIERGRRLELLLIRTASVAINATNTGLQKAVCQDDDDYVRLVELLRTDFADDLAKVSKPHAPPSTDRGSAA